MCNIHKGSSCLPQYIEQNKIPLLSCWHGYNPAKKHTVQKINNHVIANHVTNVATDLADILHSFSVVKDEDPRNEGDINHSTILTKKESTLWSCWYFNIIIKDTCLHIYSHLLNLRKNKGLESWWIMLQWIQKITPIEWGAMEKLLPCISKNKSKPCPYSWKQSWVAKRRKRKSLHLKQYLFIKFLPRIQHCCLFPHRTNLWPALSEDKKFSY